MRPETTGAGVEDVHGTTTTGASNLSRATANLTIGEGTAGISSAEPTAEIPDVALSRDDDLGRFVNSVFNLPPPPMPNLDV